MKVKKISLNLVKMLKKKKRNVQNEKKNNQNSLFTCFKSLSIIYALSYEFHFIPSLWAKTWTYQKHFHHKNTPSEPDLMARLDRIV